MNRPLDAAQSAITENRRVHDRAAARYDAGHPEIFNDVEQARLAATIPRVLAEVRDAQGPPRVLDVGAGTGNLTRHFLAAGAHVTAADLSEGMLAIVRGRFAHTGRLETLPLDGVDLRGIPDATFDVVAAYSVLHHVPDYLALVRDMVRVTRPGGVVYLDHERDDSAWSPSSAYLAFLVDAVVFPPRRWTRYLNPKKYWNRVRPLLVWQRWRNPRWMPEGDLHIWPDDHIEWAKIRDVLAASGAAPIIDEAYLLFERRYQRDAWEQHRTRTADTRMLVARRTT
ncbi:MAG: class I SAM-dependent methyltransferase [Gemmatimonadaceae bacterium]|nr:class I SAM-dependent methyltransferase [Gemmatimonadaceae bacterium]